MHFAILGSGAVGGYCAANLARAGQKVGFVARGAHLAGHPRSGPDDLKPARRVHRAARWLRRILRAIGPVDLVMLAVKTYDNARALPMLPALTGTSAVVITLQNGVDSVDERPRPSARSGCSAGRPTSPPR